jgi:poly-gamma-glutamate capsule biosynthesis protein CapA/YwtB (metallophosphatase superfamily)
MRKCLLSEKNRDVTGGRAMNRTRTERVKAEKRKRRRRRLYMLLNGLVLGVMFFLFFGLYHMENLQREIPRQSGSGQVEQAGESTAGSDPTVTLSFAGDTMMSGHVETRLRENGFDFPFVHVTSLFQHDDVTVVNLETPVTTRGTPAAKTYVYKSPPEAVPAMKTAGIDLVNLANNHSMDQGVEGLLDTMRVLDENEIAYVGAGADAARAYAPVLVERHGITIAFFGFSRVVPEVSWYAGKNKPGLAVSYDPARAVEAIRAARSKADLVVVIAHWGKEKVDLPVDHQKELARAYIDAGADLVVGSHPHVLQGVESYHGKWIAYSLGNFIFTRAAEPKTWETMVLQATCTKQGDCTLKMLPYHAELGQPVPMNEADGARLLKRIESISTHVRIDPDGSVHGGTAQTAQ